MASELDEKWKKKLTFAALPGAVRVIFEWTANSDGWSYALKSRDPEGQPIGDDSDYDILKARIGPLENLAEAEGYGLVGETRRIEMDLATGALNKSWSAD